MNSGTFLREIYRNKQASMDYYEYRKKKAILTWHGEGKNSAFEIWAKINCYVRSLHRMNRLVRLRSALYATINR